MILKPEFVKQVNPKTKLIWIEKTDKKIDII
jgi:hypothetical protein